MNENKKTTIKKEIKELEIEIRELEDIKDLKSKRDALIQKRDKLKLSLSE